MTLTFSVLEDEITILLDEMLDIRLLCVGIDGYLGVDACTSANGGDSNIKSRRVIAKHHVERRCSCSLFLVTLHRNTIQPRAAEQQPLQLYGVTVVVEVNRLVLGEETVEGLVGERMGVCAAGAEDHEIGDVDDADTEFWDEFAEEGGSSDDFESNLHTNANKGDVWVDTTVGAGELPN